MPISPQNQFLMGMGSGLLSQPYTPHPQGNFAGLGQGLQSGMDAYNNAMILAQAQAEAAAKKKEFEEQAKAKQGQREALIAAVRASGQPEPVQAAMIAQISAGDLSGVGDNLVKLATASPSGPDPTAGDAAWDSALSEYQFQGGSLDEVKNNPQVFAALKQRADQIRTTNSPPPATPASALTAAYGDVVSSRYKKVSEKADQSREMLSVYNQMSGLSGAIESGSVAQPFITSMQGLAQDFGVPIPDFAPGDSVAAKENFGALNFKLVQEQRKVVKDSQFSSKDMEIYQKAYPSLSQTKQGRELMIELQSLDLKKALEDEVWLDDKISDYQGQGIDGGRAMELALSDLRKVQNERAKGKEGLFVDENGKPTELGLRLANLTGKSPEELFGGSAATTTSTVRRMVRDANGNLVFEN